MGGDAGGDRGDAGAGMRGKYAWRPEHVVGQGQPAGVRRLSTWATHSPQPRRREQRLCGLCKIPPASKTPFSAFLCVRKNRLFSK